MKLQSHGWILSWSVWRETLNCSPSTLKNSDCDPNAEVKVGRLHDYLPHHPVIRKDRQTTKVRIVYDASAKCAGPSLNECLYAGPSLISDISGVLMCFRCHRVALSADIEKAFLMVGVADPDPDVLRFLWVDDPTSEAKRIVVKRFNRVVFGVTSSPFLLNGTIRHDVTHYESEDPLFVNEFLNSLYVDDFNGGKISDSEAFELYSKAKCRMRDGGFNLRKWISNSQKLMEWIDQEEGVPITGSARLTEEDQTYATSYSSWTKRQCSWREKCSWFELGHHKRCLYSTFWLACKVR